MSLRFVIVSLFFLLFSPIFSEETDEIRVELATRGERAPIYLSKIQGEKATFDPPYLKSLRTVLQFDLDYSGFAKISEVDQLLEKTLYHTDPAVSFNTQRWAKVGVQYVLKGEVVEKNLDLYAFNVKTGSLKKFEALPLTGTLAKDREQIHKLSDAVIKTFFGLEGIASTRILYSVQSTNSDPICNDWKGEIWECDWDGANPKQITFEQSYCITPTFIPPHPTHGNDRYLYVNYKNGQPKIYFSSIKNRTGKPLLDLRGNQLLPAVSKQRNKLAFISDAAGRADLFVQTIDDNGHLVGKPQQLFSYPRSSQASPQFSPKGDKIAFVSDKDGTPRIYLIPSQNDTNKRPKPKLLTKVNKENTCPNWSPDGTKLAYSAKTSGVRQIWIYDFETEEEMQLTQGPGNKENPCWGPDSLHLVFNSTDPDSSELYLINLNQPEAIKITQGGGKKHYPTWGVK